MLTALTDVVWIPGNYYNIKHDDNSSILYSSTNALLCTYTFCATFLFFITPIDIIMIILYDPTYFVARYWVECYEAVSIEPINWGGMRSIAEKDGSGRSTTTFCLRIYGNPFNVLRRFGIFAGGGRGEDMRKINRRREKRKERSRRREKKGEKKSGSENEKKWKKMKKKWIFIKGGR